MKVSPRESVLALVTLTCLLFGVTAVVVRPRIEELRKLRDDMDNVAKRVAAYERLVATRPKVEEEFRALSDMLPGFPASKKMDVHWLSVMDTIARRHNVRISKRQVEPERQLEDVFELPIDCKEWEATLDSIVHFLFDLQNEGAMLDVRNLYIKPKGKGLLRGRFLLYCAYTRHTEEDTAAGREQ